MAAASGSAQFLFTGEIPVKEAGERVYGKEERREIERREWSRSVEGEQRGRGILCVSL